MKRLFAAASPLDSAGPRVAPLTRWLRIGLDAFRAIGWRQWLVAAALSIGWAFANLFSHVTYGAPEISRWSMAWSFYVAHIVLTGLMLLLAVRVVERGQVSPTVSHYLLAASVALLMSVGVDFLMFHVLEIVPVGFTGDTPAGQAVHRVITMAGLLFLEGGFAVLIYARMRIAQRTQAAFGAAELERGVAARQVLNARLSALQAQVEPRFLFDTLAEVELLYKRDAAQGERMLDGLIVYLRAALPRLRGADSTLGNEIELVRAYLAVIQLNTFSRLTVDIAVPLNLGNASFPPMVLLPLVDNALRHGLEPRTRGGHISLSATRRQGHLEVEVADDGAGCGVAALEGRSLVTLRERLHGLHGDQAGLSLTPNEPLGTVAIVRVPFEAPAGPH